MNRQASRVIIARCATRAVFILFAAGAVFTGAAGAVGALFLRIELGSPTSGATSEPGAALKFGSSLNPNKLAVKTAGN